MAIGLKPLKVVKRLVRRNPDVLRSRVSWKLVMRGKAGLVKRGKYCRAG